MKKKTIGLLFGSFNPIHIGHVSLSKYFLENSDIEEVCLVVSPQNPLKEETSLLPASERLKMTLIAVENMQGVSVSDIEFFLRKPSYTVDTLKFFSEKYPESEFILIIGEDNLTIFDQWKDYQYILDNYKIYVYNRSGYSLSQLSPFSQHPNVFFFKAPLWDISSSSIRKLIYEGENVKGVLPEKVYDCIKEYRYYKS